MRMFVMVAFSLCLAGLVNAEGRVLVGDAAGSDIVQRRMLVESGPPPSVAAYVNLSLPLVNAAGYNTHPDAVALSAATDAIGPSGIGFKGYVVLKGTEVVAERYDVGDATSTYQIFSCTKSWAATMIGELLYAGKLTLSTKLEAIFTTLNWDTVNGGAKKRLITVEQLLTMSSGLTEPICGLGGATATLVATLNQGFVIDEQVGSFQYVCTQKILAWIIYEKSGLTPMEFGLSSLFPALGVSAGEFTWPIDAGTLQNTETDLHMTPRHLAKLVLLFRQQGLAAPDGPRLLSTTFVQTAMRSHWSSPWYYSRAEVCSAFSAPSAQGYGYRFQLYNSDWVCALGALGRYACYSPTLDISFGLIATNGYTAGCTLMQQLANLAFAGPLAPPPPALPPSLTPSPPPPPASPSPTPPDTVLTDMVTAP